MKSRIQMNKRQAITAFSVLIFVVGGVCVALFFGNTKLDTTDVTSVQKKVAHHLVLPVGELPAVLMVTDPSKVSIEFLKQSKEGDVVLVYQKAKKVIIYRPSIDRIIDIGPVAIDTPKGGTELSE